MDALEPIKRKIYEIRGRRVMLDSDLAALYCVETKNLNRSVKRNIDRFPDDFMFQLTKEEYDSIRCQNFTLKSEDTGSPIVIASQNVIINKGGTVALPEIGYSAIQKRRDEEENHN